MSKTSTYNDLIEGKWDCERLIFDFAPITTFPNIESVKITVIDKLVNTTSEWQGFFKEEGSKMFFYHSGPQFTDRKAEVIKLNGTVMIWEIKDGFSAGTKLTFERL